MTEHEQVELTKAQECLIFLKERLSNYETLDFSTEKWMELLETMALISRLDEPMTSLKKNFKEDNDTEALEKLQSLIEDKEIIAKKLKNILFKYQGPIQ